MRTASSRPSAAGLVVFLRAADDALRAADTDANEVVPMLMVQPSNRLLKKVASIIEVLVVTTLYETSECETRDEERVCSI
jgi:hypothetical protein